MKEEEGGERRRSKRKRVSRSIVIDGFEVLKETLMQVQTTAAVNDKRGESVDAAEKAFSAKKRKKQERTQASSASCKTKTKRKSSTDTQKSAAKTKRKTTEKRKRSEMRSVLAEHNRSAKTRAIARRERERLRFFAYHRGKGSQMLEKFVTSSVLDALPRLSDKELREMEKNIFDASRAERARVAQPANVEGGTMRDYQLIGLEWLLNMYDNAMCPILADEMGLGKTMQTIAFLAALKSTKRDVAGPHLVVAPLSVLSGWMREFRRWCPSMRVLKVHCSDKKERERLRNMIMDVRAYDVVLTTYEYLVTKDMRRTFASAVHWRVLVLDEGHRVKCATSQISAQVGKIARRSECTLLLTGTPLQNNLTELWTLLNVLYPTIFTDSAPFDDAFSAQIDRDRLDAAHYLLRPLMLRRLKSEVEKVLPPRVETKVLCQLTSFQRAWYKRLLVRACGGNDNDDDDDDDDDDSAFAAADGKLSMRLPDNIDWKVLNSLMTQLRKCCCHPFLFPEAEGIFRARGLPNRADDDGSCDESIVRASGKMRVLDRLLERLKARGHRVVIFSQYTRVLDIVDDYLVMRGYAFARLDGSTNRVQRYVHIHEFNKPNSPYFCFIMSTRAGGVGLNLQSADTVILLDSDWNPQVDNQAMARVHRIGQTKTVRVYRFVTKGTIEERMVQRAQKKLFLDTMVNRGSTRTGVELDELKSEEMQRMLTFGMDAVFESKGGSEDASGAPDLTDAEIDDLIARAEAGSTAKQGSSAAAVHDLATFDENEKMVSVTALEGTEFRRGRRKGGREKRAGEDDVEETTKQTSGKRMRTSRFVRVDGYNVLKANMYSLEDGEPSVLEREAARPTVKTDGGSTQQFYVPTSGRQVAGRDYDHQDLCQVCWDGGELVICDLCPVAVHASCALEMDPDFDPNRRVWKCPHHRCKECARSAAAAGGMLFRCEMCPYAWCEDCLPKYARDSGITNRCSRFLDLGQHHPKTACFVLCSEACRETSKRTKGGRVFDAQSDEAEGENESGGHDVTESEDGGTPQTTPRASCWNRLGVGSQLCTDFVRKTLRLVLEARCDRPLRLKQIPGLRRRLSQASEYIVTRLHTLLFRGALSMASVSEGRAAILEWGGLASENVASASKDDDEVERKEALANLFLRLVRWFEAKGESRWSRRDLLGVGTILGFVRVTTQKADGTTRKNAQWISTGASGARMAQLCELIALVLAAPCEIALSVTDDALVDGSPTVAAGASSSTTREALQRESESASRAGAIAFLLEARSTLVDADGAGVFRAVRSLLVHFRDHTYDTREDDGKCGAPAASGSWRAFVEGPLANSGATAKNLSTWSKASIEASSSSAASASSSSKKKNMIIRCDLRSMLAGDIALKWLRRAVRIVTSLELNALRADVGRWQRSLSDLSTRVDAMTGVVDDRGCFAHHWAVRLNTTERRVVSQWRPSSHQPDDGRLPSAYNCCTVSSCVLTRDRARRDAIAQRVAKTAQYFKDFREGARAEDLRRFRLTDAFLDKCGYGDGKSDTTVTIMVPKDTRPGQTVEFDFNGRTRRALVPAGYAGNGEALRIAIRSDSGAQRASSSHALHRSDVWTSAFAPFVGRSVRRFFQGWFDDVRRKRRLVHKDGLITGYRTKIVESAAPAGVESWKVADVYDWVRTFDDALSNAVAVADSMRAHGVDGPMFLAMTWPDLACMADGCREDSFGFGFHLADATEVWMRMDRFLRGRVGRWRVRFVECGTEEFDLTRREIDWALAAKEQSLTHGVVTFGDPAIGTSADDGWTVVGVEYPPTFSRRDVERHPPRWRLSDGKTADRSVRMDDASLPWAAALMADEAEEEEEAVTGRRRPLASLADRLESDGICDATRSAFRERGWSISTKDDESGGILICPPKMRGGPNRRDLESVASFCAWARDHDEIVTSAEDVLHAQRKTHVERAIGVASQIEEIAQKFCDSRDALRAAAKELSALCYRTLEGRLGWTAKQRANASVVLISPGGYVVCDSAEEAIRVHRTVLSLRKRTAASGTGK